MLQAKVYNYTCGIERQVKQHHKVCTQSNGEMCAINIKYTWGSTVHTEIDMKQCKGYTMSSLHKES